MPDGQQLTDEDRTKLFDSGTSEAAAGKVRQLFEQREHRSVHMFTNARGDRWHCFYLTYRDVAAAPLTGEHHWSEGGGHVHFINYLFNAKRLTRTVVLSALAERGHAINGVHIRYVIDRDRPDDGTRWYADGKTGLLAKVPMRKA